MPIISLKASFDKSNREISILSNYFTNCSSLDSKYQYFIGEVIMLRLFSILESSLCDLALKLACSAKYRNGNVPATHITCKTMSEANSQLISYSRKRPIRYLKWTSVKAVEDNIKHVLDVNDKFFVELNNYNNLIEEMRHVRNHIAHRNSGTATEYYKQLRLLYGGNPKIQVGAFLMSTARTSTCNLEKYLKSVPIILNDITKG